MAPPYRLLAVGFYVLAIISRQGVSASEEDGLFSIPIHWKGGEDTKFSADIAFGSQETLLEVIMDLGSQIAWVFGAGYIRWGGTGLGGPFFCNISNNPFYDPSASTTSVTEDLRWQAGYGGNSKYVYGGSHITDVITLGSGAVADIAFDLVNDTTIRQGDVNCTSPPVLQPGIFGICGSTNDSTNSGFRASIQAGGLIESPTMSMFLHDPYTTPSEGNFTGEVLLGGVDTSAYVGDLVVVGNTTHVQESGYYLPVPIISVAGVEVTTSPSQAPDYQYGKCLLDSGAHQDTWPIPIFLPNWTYDASVFLAQTGLVAAGNYWAYPSLCADIPTNATFDFTWPSVANTTNITISVPMRNYARGIGEIEGSCALNIEQVGCTFGAPFLSAAYLAVDDDHNEIALAKAGRQRGERIAIPAGGKLPGVIR